MYEENNKRIELNWGSLVLKLLFVIIIIGLVIFLIAKLVKKNSNDMLAIDDEVFITNINNMKETAFEYFTTSKLPKATGQSTKVTLEELVNQKAIIDFTNNGEACNLSDSYIQATKMADNNYALKVNLTCQDRNDFLITTIEEKDCNTNSCNVQTTKSDTTNTEQSATNITNSSSNDSVKATTSSSSGSSYQANKVATKSSTVTRTTTTTVTIKWSGTCNRGCCSGSCTPSKTRYYKHVKWSDWQDGYSDEKGAENKWITESTYDYCPNVVNTYYTASYINMDSLPTNYSYELQLLDINANLINNLRVSSTTYFNANDYTVLLNIRQRNLKEINSAHTITYYPSNYDYLYRTSLKANNFDYSISNAYLSNNSYRLKVNIKYLNNDNATAYYYYPVSDCVYFIPVKFNVSYTDMSKCITDSIDNKGKYNNYELYNLKTTYTWQHRVPTYTWSTERNISGWEYTGVYEDR